MNITPLKERVVVKPLDTEKKTEGGIYIPEAAKEKSNKGKVIAVSSEETSVKKGDIVIYEGYAGTEVTIDGEKHMIMNIKDVLAVLNE